MSLPGCLNVLRNVEELRKPNDKIFMTAFIWSVLCLLLVHAEPLHRIPKLSFNASAYN